MDFTVMNPIVEEEFGLNVFVSTFFAELDLLEFETIDVGMIFFNGHFDQLIKLPPPL